MNKKEIIISKKAKENIKILAKRAKMSSADLDNLMAAIIHEQTELGVPEDQLPDRVGRRMQASLKKQLKTHKRTNTEIKEYNEPLSKIEEEPYKKDSDLIESNIEFIEYSEKQKPDYFKQNLFEWGKI